MRPFPRCCIALMLLCAVASTAAARAAGIDLIDVPYTGGAPAVTAKTPKDVAAQLATWLTDALHAPEVRTRLVGLGLYPVGICGDDFAEHMRRQFDDYARVIRAAKITAE